MADFTNPILPGDPQGLNRLNANFDYLNQKTSALQAPPYVVASESAMLALSDAVVGNIAIRTDITDQSNQFMLTALPASSLANWMQLPMAVSTVMSVNGQTGNVVLDASDIQNPETGQSLAAAASESNIALLQADRLYPGQDLSIKFATEITNNFGGNVWGWIQARIQAGNFTGIHVGDFIPLTVAGNLLNMEVAGIDTYRRWGDGANEVGHHIDFISRDCWPATIQWNLANYNNGLASMPNPWLVSHVYAFLNGLQMPVPNAATADPTTTVVDFRTTGIYPQLPANLRNVIVQKRALLPRRYSAGILLTGSNSQDWRDMGYLWLPDEFEMYGAGVWGDADTPHQGRDKFSAVQYPLFAENVNKRVKGAGHSGARSFWWLSTPYGGNAANVALVGSTGHAGYHYAATTSRRAPVCFRIA